MASISDNRSVVKLQYLKPTLQVLRPDIAKPPNKKTDKFYLSAEWRNARELCIMRTGHRCIKCGRNPSRIFVDHIIELEDGGEPYEQSNLEPLCGSCHTRKTYNSKKAREQAGGTAAQPGAGSSHRDGRITIGTGGQINKP